MRAMRFGVLHRIFAALVLISILTFGHPGHASAATIIYVKAGATGPHNGTSWANAFPTLQQALSVAANGQQIWVAKGTYKPTLARTVSDARSKTFTFKDGVAIYGGFGGTETLLKQRNPALNVTILSGDIGVVGDASDNAYHVIWAESLSSAAILDGFRITAGNANVNYPNYWGGGFYNISGNPRLQNLTFTGNHASYAGAGLMNDHGAPALARVTFSNNKSDSYGGGIFTLSGNAILSDVTFNGNSAGTSASQGGGALADDSSNPILTRVTFSNNFASDNGGAIYNTGSSPTLLNVTFSSNSSNGTGGAIYNTSSSPALTHVTFSNDSGGDAGGHMYNANSSSPTAVNSVFAGTGDIADDGTGAASVSHSIVQAGCATASALTCVNVTVGDPRLGPLQSNGGFTKTMALLAGSPAIDAALPANCPNTDQRGVARKRGPFGACDMGAYEVKKAWFLSIAASDGYTLESQAKSNVGGTANNSGVLLVGDDKSDRRYRSILSFNTSALPDGASLALAQLWLVPKGSVGDPFGTQGTLLVDLRAPYFGQELSLVPGDYQASATVANAGTQWFTSGGWDFVALNATGRGKINKYGTTQFRVRFSTEQYNGAADYMSFYSGDSTNISLQPRLGVYFYP